MECRIQITAPDGGMKDLLWINGVNNRAPCVRVSFFLVKMIFGAPLVCNGVTNLDDTPTPF